MKRLLLLFFFLLSIVSGKSQDSAKIVIPKKKGLFYFAWGYNRDCFSKSDLHFKNESTIPDAKIGVQSYDFTIYDAKAHDRPGLRDIFRTDLTIPQYNYRIGYYLNDSRDLGIEINFDHVKYIMDDYQTLHVKGTIHGQAIDQDTLIDPQTFLHFEHSDGANFLFLNLTKRQLLLHSKDHKHLLYGVVKAGGGVVIPRTEVWMFGEKINNCFHIAGYGMGVETGFRYEAFHRVYLEYTAKGAFTDYRHVLAYGPGRAHHYFWTGENILTLGLQFGGGPKK
jgi:hypothetical protein